MLAMQIGDRKNTQRTCLKRNKENWFTKTMHGQRQNNLGWCKYSECDAMTAGFFFCHGLTLLLTQFQYLIFVERIRLAIETFPAI